jgi:hypothetical protein
MAQKAVDFRANKRREYNRTMIVKDALRTYKFVQGLFTYDSKIKGEDLPKKVNTVIVEAANPVEFPDESLPVGIHTAAKPIFYCPPPFPDKNLGTKINILIQ